MRIIADTNILLRAVLDDDVVQGRIARHTLRTAEQVVLSRHALCEMVWVLRSRYQASTADIAATISRLCEAQNAVMDAASVDAGLAMLRAGADFADGVIAHEGAWLGGEAFVTFDKKAVVALAKQGVKAKLLK